MSASDKKKLRKEQNAAAMTERQRKELKEAKKLKAYTLTFVVVMVLIVATVLGIIVTPFISGVIDRNTQALTVGDHKLTSAEMNYYYIDAINAYVNRVYSQFSNYGNYWYMFLGFDYSKPLNEQTYDEEKGTTWADYFVDSAVENATSNYALYDKAMADNHKLTENEQKSLDATLTSLQTSAKKNNVSVNKYLQLSYGNGASSDSYLEYCRVSQYATSYFSKYVDSLKYEDKDYREYEKDKFNNYSMYTYASYFVQVSKYLEGGTKSEDGKTTTYSDAEKAAALEKAKKDAEALAKGDIKNVEQFNNAIKALAINKENKNVSCTEYKNVFYEDVPKRNNEDVQKWVSDSARKNGDLTSIEVINETKNDKGEVTSKETTGFYIVLFDSANDNNVNLVDVRHILVKFPTTSSSNSSTSSSSVTDAQKKETKEKAEALLKQWQEGKGTEESFGELAKEKSEDGGSKANGGLYEGVYPGQMMDAFNDWCFDKDRKTGDTGIVETDYGYHVMYYVKAQDITYRDSMIKSDLTERDAEKWHDEATKSVTVTRHNLSRLDLDYTLS